ncbi:MAG: 4-hydroxythreonine-4-phosphate dehydrogenase PdxA [Bdellovibrionales bacterium]|nr:4-hydroxythreonine-4-phosphate dehydrogenase PdxA [Bdellovibrionales bacterium]
MSSKKNLNIVITPGDPEGIGPEVTAKALRALAPELESKRIAIFGSSKPFKKLSLPRLDITFYAPPARSAPGYQSGWAIESATHYVLANPRGRVMITGPISKERLQAEGYFYRGHTDFLASLARANGVTMMLANDLFRVALVTNHCPLSEVSKKLTPDLLETTLVHAYDFTKRHLKKKSPKIAVLGLNPHAGENGILGTEERDLLVPEIKKIQKRFKDAKITGPHPADSFFAVESRAKVADRSDLVVALYHDQGLIPVKLSDFSNSMNMTLGLPFIRTSVDHGTAFDIAGKNKADPNSMIYAIKKAIEYSGDKV